MNSIKQSQAYIVPTTHWDREWYQPQIQFQIRLVKLIDRLIKILENDPTYSCFLMDGQTVPLEDYLEIKPHNRERLVKLIREKRIIVGPWYVLADQFLQDGESTIRNLIIGMRQSKELGALPMKICYVPDSFGSSESLPMFAAGFDIPYIMFGRGRPDDFPTDDVCFMWKAQDGSKVLTANHGYGSGIFLSYPDLWMNINRRLPNGPEALTQMKRCLSDFQSKRSLTNFYISVGVDHMEPRESLPKIIEYLNAHMADVNFKITGPEDYMREIEKTEKTLETYSGEMRGKNIKGFNGCTSSHMYLKQANFRAQRWLSYYVEPMSTFALLANDTYPTHFIDRLWRLLLVNHPHDSICGCSTDTVHADMYNRYVRIDDAAAMLTERAAHRVVSVIDTRHSILDVVPVVVFNTLGQTRTDVVKQLIRIPKRFQSRHYTVVDETGTPLPSAVSIRAIKQMDLETLSMTTQQLATLASKNVSPEKSDDEIFTVLETEFIAPEVPGLGFKTFWIKPEKDTIHKTRVELTEKGMKNNFIDLSFNSNGTFNLTDRYTDRVFQNMHYFEDTEDIGDTYGFHHYEQPDLRNTLDAHAHIEKTVVLPYRITYRVEIPWHLPSHSGAKKRSEETAQLMIISDITLWADIDRVEIVTSFDNRIRDHKLCAVFDTDIDTDYTVAEGNFSLTRRPIISPPDNMESHPQQSFVSVTDGNSGLSLLNRGLPEFDVCRTKIGTKLSLTLLRCVGTIGPLAGADHPVPAAQCSGPHKAEYAVRVHDGNLTEADVVNSAHAYTVPLWCEGDIQHTGTWPNNGSLIKLQKNLTITALKKSEEDSDIVFRFWNTASDCRKVEFKGIIPFKKTWETGMNEMMIQECPKQNDTFFFEVQPNGVTTIKANRQPEILPEEMVMPMWDR